MARTHPPYWRAAALAGLSAGVVYGAWLHFVMDLMPAIGALVGAANVPAGWLVHLGLSALFGLLYAALVLPQGVSRWAMAPTSGALLGLAYGAAVWVLASFAFPVWLQAVGVPDVSIPGFSLLYLLGHLLFGAVLGASYPMISPEGARRMAAQRA